MPYSMHDWRQFRHPVVRDLAFLIACPTLIQSWPQVPPVSIGLPSTDFWQQKYLDYLPRLQQLDQQPAPLLQSIQVWPTQRLGLYAEDLLAFWLSESGWHEFALLDRHCVIQQGKRTLGELDFLVENLDDGAIEHWELAVKFYRGTGDYRPSHWLGFDPADRLGRKLHHLAQRQFDPARTRGMGVDRRRAILKGRLYWPATYDPTHPPEALPLWLNPQHAQGRWHSQPPVGADWHWVPRAHWLTAPASWPMSHAQLRYRPNGLYWHADGLHTQMVYGLGAVQVPWQVTPCDTLCTVVYSP